MDSTPPEVPAATPPSERDAFFQRLFYRWFIQYNPLYLVSAALVLAGCSLWSRGLAQADGLSGPLGIALVAEVYAGALIGGAALLWRIGFRRPAVMLSLLVVLYQWDMTLHTETCAYLGTAGGVATAVWVAFFLAKLHAVQWALEIRFARRLVTAAIVAATGLAVGPRVIPSLGPTGSGALLAAWLFALVSLYGPGEITSLGPLDAWGHTVLRRASRAAWALSGILVGLHVLMWWKDHNVTLAPVLLAAPLLLVPRVEREMHAWTVVATTLVFTWLAASSSFFVIAWLAAAALVLRALTPGLSSVVKSADDVSSPYRVSGSPEGFSRAHITIPLEISPSERTRLFTGALSVLYLGTWTAAGHHQCLLGEWPLHVLALDALLAVVVLAAVPRWKIRWPLAPLLMTSIHLVVERRLIPMPASTVAWGETIVALGFLVLGGSLATTFRYRRYAVPMEPAPRDKG